MGHVLAEEVSGELVSMSSIVDFLTVCLRRRLCS